MKKILVLAFILSASCTHYDQKIALNFDVHNQVSNIGKGVGIEVVAFDNRKDPDILGQKKYYDETVKVLADKNISEFLKNKITHNLISRGFQYGDDKKITIEIEEFKYDAKLSFIGISRIDCVVKVSVKNNKNGAIFTKKYSTNLKNRHFLMPLESRVESDINDFLKEIVQDIISDDNIIEALIK